MFWLFIVPSSARALLVLCFTVKPGDMEGLSGDIRMDLVAAVKDFENDNSEFHRSRLNVRTGLWPIF